MSIALPYPVISFDVDGTVFVTTKAKAENFTKIWCKAFGSPFDKVRASYIARVNNRKPGTNTKAFFNLMADEFLGRSLPDEEFNVLEHKFTELNKQTLPGLPPVDGAYELLEDLNAGGAIMALSTMAQHEELMSRMRADERLTRYFVGTWGGDGAFIKGRPHLERLAQIAGCKLSDILLVGDEPFDHQQARDVGAKVALVAQTHSYAQLESLNPEMLVPTFAELRPYLLV